MTIETDITTHSDLITSMNSMLPSAIYQQQTDKLPFPFNIIPTERRDATNRVIRILIWQKYGKSRFKSLTKYTPALMHYEPPRQVTTQVMPAEQLAPLMMRMLYIYFGCLHINHFCVYVSGFIRLFMKSKDQVLQSPAVLSMCSVICHQHCKHIMKIMPVEVSSEYGLFFFEQARDLVADRFDEVSLETLITYTFMALYKTKTKADQEAQDYLCIAERIRTLLLPQYGWKPEYNSTNVSDEVMTFDRISDCIQHIRTVLELHYVMQKVTKFKKAKAHGVLELIDNHDIRPKHIGPDDTEQEKKAIRLGTYTTQLREAIKQTADCAAAQDLPTYISVFGHQIEMAMRHWYRSVLPQEFRLSLPLFDDMIPDFEFFTVLEIECGSDPYPLIAAIALYNEYLIMAKSCVPKTPLDPKLNPEEIVCRLKEVINKPNQIDTSLPPRERRWLIHFMQKLRHLRQHRQDFFTEDELEESEEEFMTRFIRALDLSKVNFDMPLIHTSVRVALNMVRLIQFLLTREYSCRLDLRWVMNAWDILLRAAAFRYQQPDNPSVTLDRIRANLILCLEFIRDNVDLARKDPSGEFMAQIQQQFDKSFM
ncbi:hypothetical protein CU098_009170 [Rhizopus stolonifer]|uniref:Uncharacterized protein n=1 Tax=Rhizopus stolonifer TaxID=4846 RepID=A0A367JR43_RHIST|nr:hypothetical protein CU098_009170 [Rhizopus stolonifer]